MTSSLHLACAVFGHRTDREPVWNCGFYFATCARCQHDIVRIPGERWHRPRGARVVWSAAAPPSAQQARLDRGKSGPLQAWSELPAYSRISGYAAREIRQGVQVDTAMAEQRRSSIPDFMDDPRSPLDVSPRAEPGKPLAGARPVAARPVRVA